MSLHPALEDAIEGRATLVTPAGRKVEIIRCGDVWREATKRRPTAKPPAMLDRSKGFEPQQAARRIDAERGSTALLRALLAYFQKHHRREP